MQSEIIYYFEFYLNFIWVSIRQPWMPKIINSNKAWLGEKKQTMGSDLLWLLELKWSADLIFWSIFDQFEFFGSMKIGNKKNESKNFWKIWKKKQRIFIFKLWFPMEAKIWKIKWKNLKI